MICTTVCLFYCASVVFLSCSQMFVGLSVVGGRLCDSVVVGAASKAPKKLGQMASQIFVGFVSCRRKAVR